MFKTKVIFLQLTALLSTAIKADVCRLNLNEDLPLYPIIVNLDKYPHIIAPEVERDFVEITSSQTIGLKCINSNFSLFPELSFIEVKCIKDNIFEIDEIGQINLRELECQIIPQLKRYYTAESCASNGTLFHINFEIPEIDRYQNRWEQHSQYRKYKRLEFIDDIVEAFNEKSVRDQFQRILGSEKLALSYLKDESHTLIPYRLTSEKVFMYTSEQTFTFFEMNAVPIWKIFEKYFDNRLERFELSMQIKSEGSYHVATGVYDVLRLEDMNGELKPMYLATSSGPIPIPKYIWKMFYNWKEHFGMVAIMINNPFLIYVNPEDIFCKDICEDEIMRNFKNTKAVGFLFCCEIQEFLKVTQYKIPFYRNFTH